MFRLTSPRHDHSHHDVERIRRLLDGLLWGLLIGVAFLLGCQEVFDADIWWHVASGRWILEHGRVPRLDPFSFASADRPWIDLHWAFQVLVALANRWAGVRGIVLLASTFAAAGFAVGVLCRRHDWPSWMVALPWFPGLVVMSGRFDPRPELLTLLGMATFLAVLARAERRPAMIWLLVPVQLLWVNVHGLFILGPLTLAAFLGERALGGLGWLGEAKGGPGASERARWRVVVPAAIGVALACLANPYGLQGALFPLELWPKISASGNPYKGYIAEFMSLPSFVTSQTVAVAAHNLYFRAEYLLLAALPPSFFLPAVWGLWRRTPPNAAAPATTSSPPWTGLVALALVLGLVLASAISLPGLGTPSWMIRFGMTVPLWLALLGSGAAVALARHSAAAALLALLGGVASAAWLLWLRRTLIGPEPDLFARLGGDEPSTLAGVAVAAGALALPLVLRGGGRPFRMILAVAFGLLAFLAIRNANLFGLVAGVVLSANLGEWAARLSPGDGPRGRRLAGLAARGVLASLAAFWCFAVLTGAFHRATGERRQFGFREQPFAYAHAAARFAGRPGMPTRAFALDLRQAGVYVNHNAPARKIFMDSRLEVPSRQTFETYVRLDGRLNRGAPGWDELLRRLGDPLVLLDHLESFGAEATLLADPRWRCVYYDEVASVFLPRAHVETERNFPTYDFAAQHFQGAALLHSPAAALTEAKSLSTLGATLLERPGSAWSQRIPALLLASDRARQVLAEAPRLSSAWAILGHCHWNMEPDLRVRPPRPSEPWDPATGLPVAQATYCYQQALAATPGDIWVLLALHDAYAKRGMLDARERVASRLRQARSTLGIGRPEAGAHASGSSATLTRGDGGNLAETIIAHLDTGRPAAAAALAERAAGQDAALPWSAANRAAVTLLHMGNAGAARRLWKKAVSPPSRALLLARLAEADHVAFDAVSAARCYRESLALDPELGESWFGLALLHAEMGHAADALAACRAGLLRSLTEPQRLGLRGLEAMAARHGAETVAGGTP